MVDLHENMTALPWAKPRSSHWIAATLAVCISLMFHAAVVRFFPPVPVGRAAQVDAGSGRVPPLVLRDVRREAVPVAERPGRFESPEDALATVPRLDADALREVVAELLPAPVADIAAPLRGESEAVRPPSEIPQRAAWDVRQDVLHIRDRIVPDEVAALPRRGVPDIDRVSQAPDITPAADAGQLAQARRGADWLQSRAAVLHQEPSGLDSSEGEESGLQAMEEEIPKPRMERSDPLLEARTEITDTEAIEQLLRYQLETFWDPGDPHHTYFQLRVERATAEVLPVLPRDVLLIQDASASMTQRTIDQSKIGLRAWVDSLRAGDRFDVVAFRDDVDRAFGELASATPHSQLRAQTFIETLRARSGTDVFASLAPLLDIEPVAGRPVIAILISDGIPTVGMVSSTQILQNFSERNAGQVAMFTVGGGPQVNEYLLDFLSYKNRGDSLMTWERDQIPEALGRLSQELNRPVLTDLQHQIAGDDTVEMYPRLLSHLFLDRPLVMFGRKPVDQESMILRILGRSGGDRKDMVFTVQFSEGRAGESTIRTEWAWQKVYHLIGEHIQSQDPETLARIRQLADLYGLSVLYGDDRVPMTFQRRFRFHGQQAE